MKKTVSLLMGVVLAIAALVAFVPAPPAAFAQESAAQVALQQKFVLAGPRAQGAGVMQTGEVDTLSAAVASATLTQVVAAPTSGSIYLRALLVEKATASTGSVTVKYGTGTNCGTGTTTLLGPVTVPPVGRLTLDIQVPAANALCILTDASTTSVRVLGQ